jgi:hypothetical protein
MSTATTVQDLNRQLAKQINQEARANPQSPYANKWVGIANGKVEVVSQDFEDMLVRLEKLEPDPSKTLGVEASYDFDQVEEIWGNR